MFTLQERISKAGDRSVGNTRFDFVRARTCFNFSFACLQATL